MPATQPIPPDVAGHDPDFNVSVEVRSGDGEGAARPLRLQGPRRRRLARSAGRQAARAADGQRRRPARDRERDELWKKSMTRDRHPDRVRQAEVAGPAQDGRAPAKLQMWPVGWITTYGEGDAFMQLLYSGNIGQSNYARFVNAEYDDLYRQSKRIPDGPERNAIYRRMAEHRRRVQPVGSRRLPDREHAGAAVGARLQQARVQRASVAVPRHRPRAAAAREVTGRCSRCDRLRRQPRADARLRASLRRATNGVRGRVRRDCASRTQLGA